MQPRPSLRVLTERIGRAVALFTAGGGWTAQLAPAVRRNLRWYYFDGVLASSQEAINATYLTLFVLALGASKAQIGLMASLASVGSMLLLLPGALMVERTGKRKWLVVASGGGVTRLAILGLAVLPFFASGPTAVAVAILLKVLMDSSSNLGNPAWTSLTADLVPIAWRGRFFGTRNMVMGTASMLVTFLAGQIITASANPIAGYQTVYGLAVLFGAGASFCFASIQEPQARPDPAALEAYRPAKLIQALREDRLFLNFCIAQMVWNFSIAVAGPFFSVYQIEKLNSTPAIIGIQVILSSLAGIPAQQLFGRLNDRWGERKLLTITGFLIPLLPAFWALTRGPWDPTPMNVLGGAIWAGYSLANFNFLLSICTAENRARYTAIFQFSVMISAALGSAAGGLIVDNFDFRIIFLVSAAGRLLGHLLLWRLFRNK
jgi:MFS family permease